MRVITTHGSLTAPLQLVIWVVESLDLAAMSQQMTPEQQKEMQAAQEAYAKATPEQKKAIQAAAMAQMTPEQKAQVEPCVDVSSHRVPQPMPEPCRVSAARRTVRTCGAGQLASAACSRPR